MAATALGVSREHLRLVIQGKRKNPELLARYNALKESSMATYSLEFQNRLIEKIQETAALAERIAVARSSRKVQSTMDQVATKVARIPKDEGNQVAGASTNAERPAAKSGSAGAPGGEQI